MILVLVWLAGERVGLVSCRVWLFEILNSFLASIPDNVTSESLEVQ